MTPLFAAQEIAYGLCLMYDLLTDYVRSFFPVSEREQKRLIEEMRKIVECETIWEQGTKSK